MTADDWLIENAGVPDLEHTVRSLQAENERLRMGITKFIDYQTSGSAPGEWSYTLVDLRALLSVPVAPAPDRP